MSEEGKGPDAGTSCLIAAAGLLIFTIFILLPALFGVSEDSKNGVLGPSVAGASGLIPGTTTELTINGKTIKLPISFGKVGKEQYLPGMSFSKQCDDEEEKWYITMRWPFAKWAFSGLSKPAESTSSLYAKKRIIVHNPETKKSVVTAICESGPAPWTGSSWYESLPKDTRSSIKNIFEAAKNNPPSNWPGYLQFDPVGADGRVAGLPDAPWDAIGAKNNGVLQYGFALDQTIPLGPLN